MHAIDIGVTARPVGASHAKELCGLSVRGLAVVNVRLSGLAEDAGLIANDVIVEIADKRN
ncbi:MAG: hypothetical protein P4L46_06135 [Fimbriimonas sp.]|nr:hypothetical protein [Fimbriimonas sp.]